jgi:deoxyribonuclease V
MLLAFDTFYTDTKAKTVCISFEKWTDTNHSKIYTEIIDNTEQYEPGFFYKKELPCIISLLQKTDLTDIEAILIDGFVVLDDAEKKGLGGYLYEHLQNKIPVIGVAKNPFTQINKNQREIYRGNSRKPLYVTALGMDLDVAGEQIKKMSGNYRIPDLLKQLDILTKVVSRNE